MAAEISVRSATASVVEKLTAAHVEVTGAESNEEDGTERRYYLIAEKSGIDPLRSHVFSPNFEGKHWWDDVLFPDDGSWTIELRDVSDDSVVATESVTVAASA